jgi:transcriptional regulator with XRE-family HTH domain
VSAGQLIRRARQSRGLSQQRLALRAATDQAAISRIERGEISPSVETVERLLAAMGERLHLDAAPPERDYDLLHMRASLERTPAERLELAISWNRLAGRLTEAGRRASAG